VTPSITPSPAISYTPTSSPTPKIPLSIEIEFESTITPNSEAVFSRLTFTDGLDDQYRPLKPGEVFQNPINHMYAVFSYDNMVVGSQWSALWYREDELVHYETIPWDGGSGGLGFTDWEPDPSEWTPGEYQVQIFTGLNWKRSGFFTVEGEPPTAVPSATFTPSKTPTITRTATRTPWPSSTPVPSRTPFPSATPRLTNTPRATSTPYKPPTITPTQTPWPTITRTPVTPTITPWPTRTRTPTPTSRSTITY
jgi:type VI secretion system secreted protein VgrG